MAAGGITGGSSCACAQGRTLPRKSHPFEPRLPARLLAELVNELTFVSHMCLIHTLSVLLHVINLAVLDSRPRSNSLILISRPAKVCKCASAVTP